MVPIDIINKAVLLSVFLIGFLLGGVISFVVQELNDRRRRDMERNHDD